MNKQSLAHDVGNGRVMRALYNKGQRLGGEQRGKTQRLMIPASKC